MLTKNCRIVLKALNSKANDKFRFGAMDIAELTGMTFDEASRAAEYLTQQGFLERKTRPDSFVKEYGIELYSLTELGADYKAVACAKRWEYVREKWIDFLAMIVAIVALIVSIVNSRVSP